MTQAEYEWLRNRLVELLGDAAALKTMESVNVAKIDEHEKMIRDVKNRVEEIGQQASLNSGKIEEMSASKNKTEVNNTQDNSNRSSNSITGLLGIAFLAVVVIAILYGAYLSFEWSDGTKLNTKPNNSRVVE